MARLTAVLALGLLIAGGAIGCGGDDSEPRVSEDSLRSCLADAGLTLEAPAAGSSAGFGSATPDFRATTVEGTAVDLIVLGSDQRAERTAADIRASRQGFGGSGDDVLAQDNAVAVFAETPSGGSRGSVEKCLGAQD
jgi:hypothetical protein